MKISIIVIVNKKAHSQNEQLVKAVRDIQSVQYYTILEVIRLRTCIQEVFKDSSTLRDRTFFYNLAYISGESNQILMKISSLVYPWTRCILVSGVHIWIRTQE